MAEKTDLVALLDSTTEKQSRRNIRKFIEDTELEGIKFQRKDQESKIKGYFTYIISGKGSNGLKLEIEMAGVPMEYTGYTTNKKPKTGGFVDVYLDGHSCEWIVGVYRAKTKLVTPSRII